MARAEACCALRVAPLRERCHEMQRWRLGHMGQPPKASWCNRKSGRLQSIAHWEGSFTPLHRLKLKEGPVLSFLAARPFCPTFLALWRCFVCCLFE
jgi:hypothetical protein